MTKTNPLNTKLKYENNYLKTGKYQFNLIYKRENLTDENAHKNLIKIHEISITNTKHGGGYSCNPCMNGLKTFNCEPCKDGEENISGVCRLCKEGYFKNELNTNCVKCPIFTKSSRDRKNCEPKSIIEIQQYSYKFFINGLNNLQKNECDNENKICYDSFIGPIDNIKEREIFYISFAKRAEIDIADFSYSTNRNKKTFGHLFYLKNSNVKVKETFEKHENLKMLFNIGSYIEYIKLLPMLVNKDYKLGKTTGYYIKYSQGDLCLSDPSRNYTSYLFNICDKYTNNNYPMYKFKMNNNCTFVFEWKSKYGCKSCNLDETEKNYGVCRDGKRNIFHQEKEFCIIDKEENYLEPEDKTNQSTEPIDENQYNFDTLFYSKNTNSKDNKDVELYFSKILSAYDFEDMSYFKNKDFSYEEFNSGNNQKNFTDKQKNSQGKFNYIESINVETTCKIYEDFNNIVYIIIIAVPVCYLLLIIYLIYVYCKYKKIYSQYSRLKEEKEGDNTNSNDKDINKIELANTSHHQA